MIPDPEMLAVAWRPVLAAAAAVLAAHPGDTGDTAVLAALGWLVRTRAESAAFTATAKVLRRHAGGMMTHAWPSP